MNKNKTSMRDFSRENFYNFKKKIVSYLKTILIKFKKQKTLYSLLMFSIFISIISSVGFFKLLIYNRHPELIVHKYFEKELDNSKEKKEENEEKGTITMESSEENELNELEIDSINSNSKTENKKNDSYEESTKAVILKKKENDTKIIEKTTTKDVRKDKIPESIKNEPNIININVATVDEFKVLNGIGEKKAIMVINYRNEHGAFSKIEDIMNVSGIGQKTFDKNKEFLRI